MSENSAQLTLSVDAGQNADQEESAELARRLRQFMLDRDIDKVEFARTGPAPAGSKGDAVSLASLAVTTAPAVFTTLGGLLQSWLTRHERASITVESGGEKLTLSGSVSRDQQQILSAFLDRHKQQSA
jgi:hypothetical protein